MLIKHKNKKVIDITAKGVKHIPQIEPVDSFVHEAVYFELARRRLFSGFSHDNSWADMHEYITYIVAPYKSSDEFVTHICDRAFKILDDIATNINAANYWRTNFIKMTNDKLVKSR